MHIACVIAIHIVISLTQQLDVTLTVYVICFIVPKFLGHLAKAKYVYHTVLMLSALLLLFALYYTVLHSGISINRSDAKVRDHEQLSTVSKVSVG